MQYKTDVENAFLLLLVALAFGIRHEPLRGAGHGGVEEAQHGDGSAHDVENTEVGRAEGVEDQSGGVEGDEHRDAHLRVEVTCVLYDSGCG